MNRIACIDISEKPWLRKSSLPPNYFVVQHAKDLKTRNNVGDFIVVATDVVRANFTKIKALLNELMLIRKSAILIYRRNEDSLSDLNEMLALGFVDVVHFESIDQIEAIVTRHLNRASEIDRLLNLPMVQKNLIGQNARWLTILRQVIEAGRFSDANIMLTGESGTGKELVTRLLHGISTKRQNGKLIIVDCTTLSKELSGSELFGHERGAYTNAVSCREGAFSLANGGTLFLDEIGELPLTLQTELLRVVQEGKFKRVGGNNWESTDVRIVCATNKDLPKMVERGEFRADLYYRLSGICIQTISLQERKDDIPLLVENFIEEHTVKHGLIGRFKVSGDLMQFLLNKEYPGNVRELKQIVQRLLLKHEDVGWITMGDLHPLDRFITNEDNFGVMDSQNLLDNAVRIALENGEPLGAIRNRTTSSAIRIALDIEKGNKTKAAKRLEITLRAIQMFNKRSGLDGEI